MSEEKRWESGRVKESADGLTARKDRVTEKQLRIADEATDARHQADKMRDEDQQRGR